MIRRFERFVFYLPLLAIIVFESCNLINPAEPVPAYIQIDTTYINTYYTTQGSASHKIKDAWIYVNEQLLGGFGVPGIYPIKNTGTNVTLDIRPGVLQSGLSSTHVIYPFYQTFDTVLNLEPGKTYKINPITTYITGAVFPLIEDFDDGSFEFMRAANSDTSLQAYSTNPFEGANSGVFYLDKTNHRGDFWSSKRFTLTKGLNNVIELNYKTDNYLTIGLVANFLTTTITEERPIITLKPTTGWNKIYIDLASEVLGASGVKDYNVFFAAFLDAGRNHSTILVDNIKLVHN